MILNLPTPSGNYTASILSSIFNAIRLAFRNVASTNEAQVINAAWSIPNIVLPDSGVTTGTYTLSTVVVDAKGRVTSASSGVGGGGGAITLTGDVTGTGTGTLTAALATTGVSAGTYSKVTVDTKGRVTTGTNIVSADVTGALGFTPIAGNQTITFTGDATGSGTTAVTLTQANSGVTAGTYTLSTVVVDAKGRVTSASSGVGGGGGGLSQAEVLSRVFLGS